LKVWWAKVRGKPNPMLKIGENDHGNCDGEEVWALKDVSFQVEQGDVLGIIGRNGAGKSTLLKILSRVTAPTSGVVKVKGRVASLLEVGTGFHPDLTGRENVYLNGSILGMSRREIDRKFDEIVDFAEVEKFIDTPVKRYSSGMYVRLAFAVAAHLEPEILVVDEVLAVGDAEFQKKCLGKMSDVAKEGRTVLFVSHNMVAVEQLCQRGILLSKGALDCLGKVEDIVDHYLQQTSYSKEYFKEISGNNENYFIKVIDFYITNRKKDVLKLVRVGDELTLAIKIFSKKEFSNITIGIGLNDNHNLRISTLHNGISGYPLSFEKGENIVACHIQNLSLMNGTYTLDIKIYSNNEPILFSENFYQLIIQPGNIYKSGRLPDSSWGGVCHLMQDWEVRQGE